MPWVICSEKRCPTCGEALEDSPQIRRPRWWARRVDATTWRHLARKPDDWRGRVSPALCCPEGHGVVLVERDPDPAQARGPAGPPSPEAIVVYVAPTGTHYHDEGCGLLQGRGRAVRLSEALAAGLQPCRLHERRGTSPT